MDKNPLLSKVPLTPTMIFDMSTYIWVTVRRNVIYISIHWKTSIRGQCR